MAYTKLTNFDPGSAPIPDSISPPPRDMGIIALHDQFDEFVETFSRPMASAAFYGMGVATESFPALSFLPFKRPVKGYLSWVGDGATVRPSTGYLYPRKSTV